MHPFATKVQSRSERRPTRRLRRVLSFAAAGSAMSVVLANPALAASPSAVENTVAAPAGVANNVVQSTPAANVTPPAPPAPPPAAEPAPPPPAPVPGAGGESGAGEGAPTTAEETIGGAAETANDALSGLAGKTATDLTDTVDKASGGIVGGAAPKPPTGESLGGEALRPPAGSPGHTDPPSGSSSPLALLPKLTIAPILPANPILPNEPLLPGLLDGGGGPVGGLLPALGETLGQTLAGLPTPGLDLGGILGPGGPVGGLLPALGETLGDTLGGLTPGLDLGGILGGGLQLIAPPSGGGTVPPSPPGVPSGLSDPGDQSGSLIDQPYGSHVVTDAPDLPAIPKAGLAPNAVLSAAPWDSLITGSMSSTSSPSVESAAAGGSPDHRPLPGPASPSGAVSSAPNGLLLFGFAAMLLAALAAAAPAIRRLIQIAPACWRPAPFVALLEPPG